MSSHVEKHHDLQTRRRGQGGFLQVAALTISGRQVYQREGNVDVERMMLRQSKELMFISQGKHIKLPIVPGRGGGGKTVF